MIEKTQRGNLGRGLAALFGDEEEGVVELDQRRSAKDVPIEQIHPNANQPRRHFNEDALEELSESIRSNGVLQPILVRDHGERSGEYEIVDRDYTKVKKSLLDSLTNFGNPIIKVADDNYLNRGELYLYHEWVSRDLEFEAALRTQLGQPLGEGRQRPLRMLVEVEEVDEAALALRLDGNEPHRRQEARDREDVRQVDLVVPGGDLGDPLLLGDEADRVPARPPLSSTPRGSRRSAAGSSPAWRSPRS